MSFRRHTRVLSVILLSLSALHCSDGGLTDGLAQAFDTGLDEECVASPSELTAAPPVGGGCTFDQGSLSETCVRSAAGREIVETSRFASIDDYVEASQHLGKLTSLDHVRSDAGVQFRTALHYDEVGRLARSVLTSEQGNIVHRFSAYDAFDRPVRAVMTGEGLSQAGCAGYAITFDYSEDLGIISRHIQPLSTQCADGERVELGYSTLPSGVEHQLCP